MWSSKFLQSSKSFGLVLLLKLSETIRIVLNIVDFISTLLHVSDAYFHSLLRSISGDVVFCKMLLVCVQYE